MGDFKDKTGESRVGKLLRDIGRSDLVNKALGIAGDSGGFLGVIGTLLQKDNTISPEHYELALKELEKDIAELEAVTRRWEADMKSDKWFPSNVRPMVLAFLTVSVIVIGILDASLDGFTVVDSMWNLLSMGWSTVFIAFFGSRGIEKGMKIWKGR